MFASDTREAPVRAGALFGQTLQAPARPEQSRMAPGHGARRIGALNTHSRPDEARRDDSGESN